MTVDLRSVAELSGVSVSTASRALSGSPRVNEETRRRVQVAAEKLGYRPNATARALRTAHSQLIGLVVTNLVNASFHVIAEIVQRRLAEQGYQMVLSITGGDADQERAALSTLIDHNATGVIVVGSDSQATQELHRRGLPVVHLARRPDEPAGDCVLGDDLTGARVATKYLLAKGHRRIGVIAGPQDVTSGRERLLGYRLEMDEMRVSVRDEWVVWGPFTPATGASGVETLMNLPPRQRPTALIIANHEAAFGALPALQEQGISVPDELSVVCYEDAQLMRWWHPGVTVIDNNAAEMGELAARLLLERILGSRTATAHPSEFRVGTRLIERGSCAGPARGLRS
jgi:LacI family transcriptional regulator